VALRIFLDITSLHVFPSVFKHFQNDVSRIIIFCTFFLTFMLKHERFKSVDSTLTFLASNNFTPRKVLFLESNGLQSSKQVAHEHFYVTGTWLAFLIKFGTGLLPYRQKVSTIRC